MEERKTNDLLLEKIFFNCLTNAPWTVQDVFLTATAAALSSSVEKNPREVSVWNFYDCWHEWISRLVPVTVTHSRYTKTSF